MRTWSPSVLALIIVVEANLGDGKARFINAYGPQESENEETKSSFYSGLDMKIKSCKLAGKMVCISLGVL